MSDLEGAGGAAARGLVSKAQRLLQVLFSSVWN